MSSNWIAALDACAAGGVLDYDAASDILGQPARFVGNPDFNTMPALLPPGTKLQGNPKTDEYTNSNVVKNPSWKKWTFAAITTALVGGGILARLVSKGKINMPKNIKMPDMAKLKTHVKNFGTTTLNYLKKPFIWIGNKFKKKP